MAVVTPRRAPCSPTSTAMPIAKTPDAGHLGSDRGREGRLQALHAQGDLRAAGGGARHHPAAASRSSSGTIVPRRDRARRRRRFAAIDRVTLVACGTSWHAALVGKFLIEELARMPVEVDYGSEFRYRDPLAGPDDAGRRDHASRARPPTRWRRCARRKRQGARSLAICNVVGSMATRESRRHHLHARRPRDRRRLDQGLHRAAGRAATCSRCTWPQARGTLTTPTRARLTSPSCCSCRSRSSSVLKCAPQIEDIAARFHARTDFLYLGRGINYPIALEGALKLKEISYIHAEGYPAGEMKHGPIALIDEQMPVVAIAPHDHVFEKMQWQHPGGQGARRRRDRDHHRRRRHAVATARPQHRLDHRGAGDVAAAGADRRSPCRCSCSPTTSPCAAAATSISRATWRRASR